MTSRSRSFRNSFPNYKAKDTSRKPRPRPQRAANAGLRRCVIPTTPSPVDPSQTHPSRSPGPYPRWRAPGHRWVTFRLRISMTSLRCSVAHGLAWCSLDSLLTTLGTTTYILQVLALMILSVALLPQVGYLDRGPRVVCILPLTTPSLPGRVAATRERRVKAMIRRRRPVHAGTP